jgi:hypothetical protein
VFQPAGSGDKEVVDHDATASADGSGSAAAAPRASHAAELFDAAIAQRQEVIDQLDETLTRVRRLLDDADLH